MHKFFVLMLKYTLSTFSSAVVATLTSPQEHKIFSNVKVFQLIIMGKDYCLVIFKVMKNFLDKKVPLCPWTYFIVRMSERREKRCIHS